MTQAPDAPVRSIGEEGSSRRSSPDLEQRLFDRQIDECCAERQCDIGVPHSAVGCAVHSTLPAEKGYTTLELKVNYVRAATADAGPLRAEGKVIHVGGQIATAQGRLYDAAGKLYAHASTTCLIFSLPAADV